MAGGVTGIHTEGEADPAADANAQDTMLIAHDFAITQLQINQPQYRDLGAGPVFPTVGPNGSPLADQDAFDLG